MCVCVCALRPLPSPVTALATLRSSRTPRMLAAVAMECSYSLNLPEQVRGQRQGADDFGEFVFSKRIGCQWIMETRSVLILAKVNGTKYL